MRDDAVAPSRDQLLAMLARIEADIAAVISVIGIDRVRLIPDLNLEPVGDARRNADSEMAGAVHPAAAHFAVLAVGHEHGAAVRVGRFVDAVKFDFAILVHVDDHEAQAHLVGSASRLGLFAGVVEFLGRDADDQRAEVTQINAFERAALEGSRTDVEQAAGAGGRR